MKLSPRQQVNKFIIKHLTNEKDKWNSGMKNDYYAWQDLADDMVEYFQKRELQHKASSEREAYIIRLEKVLNKYGLLDEAKKGETK